MKNINFILIVFLLFTAGISLAQEEKKAVKEKTSTAIPPALKLAPPEVTPAIRGFIEKIDGHKVTIKRKDSTQTVTVKEPDDLKTFNKGDLVKFQKGVLEKLLEKKTIMRMKPSFKPAVPPKPNVKPVVPPKTKTK